MFSGLGIKVTFQKRGYKFMQIGHGHGRINFMHDSSAGIRESLLIVNAFITQNCAGGYPDCFFWIGVPSGILIRSKHLILALLDLPNVNFKHTAECKIF